MDTMVVGVGVTFIILIVAHFCVSHRAVPAEQVPSAATHWTYRISVFLSFSLLFAYLFVLSYVFYKDTDWPHVGSLSIVLFLLMCPAVLFHIYFLTYSLIKRKLPSKRLLARILSIVLGMVVGSQIPLYAQKVAMDSFVTAYQPLLESIRENFPNPCTPQIPYTEQSELKKLKDSGQLWHDKEHFILIFRGGSADLDGSTIYYSSKEGEFKIFHNDNKEESRRLEALLTKMKSCRNTVSSAPGTSAI